MIKVSDKRTLTIYLILAVAVVLAVNLVSRDLFFRLDFTDTGMYSLSESSVKVLGKVDDRLTMKVYFSKNLPGQYGNNRRYLQDILEEYEAYGDGNIHFEFYEPESDDKLPQEAMRYGIQPVQLQVIEHDKLEVKRVYMGLVLLYEDERETIPVIQTTTGLEYEITTRIKKLVDTEKKAIAFADIGSQDVQTNTVSQALRQSYNLRTVSLASGVPPDINLLLVNGVEDSVSAGELDNLKAFVRRGGNLFIAQGRVSANLQEQMGTPIQSNIFDFLEGLGLRLEENLVLDQVCSNVSVVQNVGFFRMNTQMPYPFFPLVQRFGDHITVVGLEQLRLLYTSEIAGSAQDDTLGASPVTPLLMTSDRSAAMTNYFSLSPVQNPIFNSLDQPGKVVGALALVESDSVASFSQVILVGNSKFFADDGGATFPENTVFVANAVDYLMGDSDLVALRSREITTRPLQPLDDASKAQLKWINILLPPLLIVGYGILRWRRENNRAKALEESYDA